MVIHPITRYTYLVTSKVCGFMEHLFGVEQFGTRRQNSAFFNYVNRNFVKYWLSYVLEIVRHSLDKNVHLKHNAAHHITIGFRLFGPFTLQVYPL